METNNTESKESSFVIRLREEKDQLNEKLDKLNAFLVSENFKGVEPIQQSLLNIQANVMLAYSQILLDRLTWLSKPLKG